MEQENTFSDIASEPIFVRPTTSYADIMGKQSFFAVLRVN